jgi:hypothetical protein
MQRRPFRFLTGWINHEDFEGLMHREWRNELTSWNSNLYHLKEALKVWNRDVFGNIFVRKKYLLRQLCRIEREMACRWSQELEFDQRLVWKEYEECIANEELLWFQKSRTKWLEQGDRNTRYFHGVTAIRRRKNKVETIQNEEGVWVTDQAKMERVATEFYKCLFTNNDLFTSFFLAGAFPIIDEHKLNFLAQPVTNREIYEAVFNIGALKAPGRDGFHGTFYHSQWGRVGSIFCDKIKEIFE